MSALIASPTISYAGWYSKKEIQTKINQAYQQGRQDGFERGRDSVNLREVEKIIRKQSFDRGFLKGRKTRRNYVDGEISLEEHIIVNTLLLQKEGLRIEDFISELADVKFLNSDRNLHKGSRREILEEYKRLTFSISHEEYPDLKYGEKLDIYHSYRNVHIGNGFMISKHYGIVIGHATNHSLSTVNRHFISFKDSNLNREAYVLAKTTISDMALLYVPDSNISINLPIGIVDPNIIKNGAGVINIGFFKGIHNDFTINKEFVGIRNGIHIPEGNGLLQDSLEVNGPIERGYSGSPNFTVNNNLLGLTSTKLKKAPNVGSLTPATNAFYLMEAVEKYLQR